MNRTRQQRVIKKGARSVGYSTALGLFLSISTGCVTSWSEAGSVPSSSQTHLHISSTPPGAAVLVNNVMAGVTPLTTPFLYQTRQVREERGVSPWLTNPGLTLFISIWTLGSYVPIAMFPWDTEDRFQDTDQYSDNDATIRFEIDGYKVCELHLSSQGERERDVSCVLETND